MFIRDAIYQLMRECGHAVQHDTGYPFLQTRSALVPFVQTASKAQSFLLIIALILASTMSK
jgi:Zn-dependent membrane protease YugP